MNPPTGTKEPDAPTRELPQAHVRPSLPLENPAAAGAPPAPLIVAPRGDACPSCGSPMAADQRYCLDCGRRRGEPRLPLMDGRGAAEPAPAAAASPAHVYSPPTAAGPRPRWAASVSLILGVGVLLLAMGVGVLIGNNGNGDAARTQAPVIIGGGAAVAAGPTGATDASDAAKADKAEAKDAAAEESGGAINADKTAKANGVKLAPDDAKIGDKCEKGAVGCEDGEFTGDYFGN